MKNIYVGNLKGNCGPCSRATDTWKRSALYVTATGQSRGFAFVEMSNHNEAEIAIHKLNGTNLAGCRIKVNEARPVVRKNSIQQFFTRVTLLHPDRVVKVLSFLFLNVADFRGVQAG